MFPAPCVSVRKYIQTSKVVFLVNFFSVLFICILHHSTPQCYQSIIPLSSPSPPHYLHLRITFFNALLCRHRTRNRKLSSPWGGYHKNICFYPKMIPSNPPLQPSHLLCFKHTVSHCVCLLSLSLFLISSWVRSWSSISTTLWQRTTLSQERRQSHLRLTIYNRMYEIYLQTPLVSSFCKIVFHPIQHAQLSILVLVIN